MKENPRQFGLCSYIVTDEAPDVIVAPDLSLDNSVNHNPRLQHLRFFAGVIITLSLSNVIHFTALVMLFHIRVLQAALKVGGIRLGSFTLLDRKPRTMSTVLFHI